MSELKVHKIGDLCFDFKMGKDVGIDFYLKSEADKVISEWRNEADVYKSKLEKEYDIAVHNEKQLSVMRINLRHNKYKRCFAMAEMCGVACDKWTMKRKAMGVADLSRIPTCAEFARLKQELELLRAKLPKWHRCDEPDEDGFFDLPPESGSYFAQYETTWADGVTKRYCEPLEYDADACDWPQLTGHCRVIRWCERPEPPED